MGVTALDMGKEELAKSNPPAFFLGEAVWCVYSPGLGKAGSNLASVILSEQAQPLPLLRSDLGKEEDGYQVSHGWNVVTSLHALPHLAGKPGNPWLFLVQTGLLFVPLAAGEVGWLPALVPSLGGTKLPAGKLWQGRELELSCPSTLLSYPSCAGSTGSGWMCCP